MRLCSIDGCAKPHHAQGYCTPHYHRHLLCGNPVAILARGTPPVLSYPKLRRIDAWFATKNRHLKVLAAQLGVSISTIYAARHRRGAYREIPGG